VAIRVPATVALNLPESAKVVGSAVVTLVEAEVHCTTAPETNPEPPTTIPNVGPTDTGALPSAGTRSSARTEPAILGLPIRRAWTLTRALFELHTANWDVAPDGKRLLVVKEPEAAAGEAKLQAVVNWFEELRQRRRNVIAGGAAASVCGRCSSWLPLPLHPRK
jgi:hypothetical protein